MVERPVDNDILKKIRASLEGGIADLRPALREHDRGQGRTAVEGAGLDLLHALRDHDRSQAGAAAESVEPDLRHAVGDTDGFQVGSLPEGFRTNDSVLRIDDGDIGFFIVLLTVSDCVFLHSSVPFK